jgi:chloramphenicol-sensitive protein RarD
LTAPASAQAASTAYPEERRGTLFGASAYLLWGAFPLYFPLLKPAGAVEILLHRVVWSLVVCALVLTVVRGWRQFAAVFRSVGRVGALSAAAVFIAVNWGVYIYAVNSGHVVEAALGYFVNPLVTVLLGVVVLRERLRVLQWVAVGIGFGAVAVLTFAYGRPPWIAAVLAFSFATYGLIKNRVGRGVGALTSLSVETAVLTPFALVWLVWMELNGTGTFTDGGTQHSLLLAAAGVVTAVPLLLFAAAARRVPLSTIGLLQYLTPTLQFLIGVLIMGEQMPPARWVGFTLVWLALVVLTWDGLRTAHNRARLARAASRSAAVPSSVGDQEIPVQVPPAH